MFPAAHASRQEYISGAACQMGVSQAAFRWEAEDEEDAGFARGINTASSRSANDAMNGSTATARFWRGGAGTRSQAQSWGSGWEARCVYRLVNLNFRYKELQPARSVYIRLLLSAAVRKARTCAWCDIWRAEPDDREGRVWCAGCGVSRLNLRGK